MSGELLVQNSKLIEWLLSRRLIPEKHAHLLLGVEAKIGEALAVPVADEHAKDLIAKHKEAMNYVAVKQIYEAVAKSPEGQAKSMLGSHTNPGPAKWKAALDAYKRKNLGVANCARIIMQNVSYEIPALKKHMAACERQVADFTTRQAELTRMETNARARYQMALDELGIDGFNPRNELRSYTEAQLPMVQDKLATALQSSCSTLLDHYTAFITHVAGEPSQDPLPLLRTFLQGGASTCVEDAEEQVPALKALRSEAAAKQKDTAQTATDLDEPSEIQVQDVNWDLAVDENAGPATSEGINWGDNSQGISWDLDVQQASTTGGIDWGVEVSQAGEAPTSDAGMDCSIDWGAISFEGLEIKSGADEGSKAAEKGGTRLIEDSSARELLCQEVFEIDAFVAARLAETSGGSCEEQLPDSLHKSAEELKAFAAMTGEAVELLTGKLTQRLVLLRTSTHYLEQRVKQLNLLKARCGKPVTQRAELEKLKTEQTEESARAKGEVDKLRQATLTLQKEFESELSAYLKSTVRIVGEIAKI